MAELLSFRSLYASDERHAILAGLTLHVDRSETVAIVGESGCGKTMSIGALLDILPDDVSITAGSIVFDGEDVLSYSGKERKARLYSRIGFVPQNTSDSLYPLMTVADVMTDAYTHNHPDAGRRQAREKAAMLLSSLGIEDAGRVLSLYPFQLSGGMKQRVGIARAYCNDPQIMLLDEPFGQLDAQTRLYMEKETERIWLQEKRTVIFVTNNIDEALTLGDRIYTMKDKLPGTLCNCYEVDLPRPRESTDKEFLRLRKQIIEESELVL